MKKKFNSVFIKVENQEFEFFKGKKIKILKEKNE